MAVKKHKTKVNYSKWLTENAIKIKCCYCDSKDTCKYRARKEATEKMNIVTKCTMTPNRKKKVAPKMPKAANKQNKNTCVTTANKVQLKQV